MPVTYPDVEIGGGVQDDTVVQADDTRSVIVGPAERGPVFVPTAVGDANAIERVFGASTYQAVWSAQEQAAQGGVPRIVRVAETAPYDPKAIVIGLADPGGQLDGTLYEHGSTPSSVLAAVLLTTRQSVAGADVTGTWSDTCITLRNASGAEIDALEASLDPGSPRYLPSVIDQLDGVDVHANFVDTQVRLRGNAVIADFVPEGVVDLSAQPPTRAATPWVVSNDTVSRGVVRLFRFHALDEGRQSNRRVKVSVRGVTAGGQFDVVVRRAGDSDLEQDIIERFTGLSLDPESDDFIARRIGDDTTLFDGERLVSSGGSFPLQSDYIRVQMASVTPPGAYPWGNEGYREPVSVGADVAVPLLPIVRTQEAQDPFTDLGVRRRRVHLGADASSTQAQAFLNPVPAQARQQPGFTVSADGIAATDPAERKFTLVMQGGYAGGSVYRDPLFRADVTSSNQQGLDCSAFDAPGTQAYATAFDVIRDPIEISVGHLSLPGCTLSKHPSVIQQAEALCDERGACVLTAQADVAHAPVSDIMRAVSRVSGDHVAPVHGWISTDLGPAPVEDAIAAVFRRNDRIGSPATVPAGRVRGALTQGVRSVIDVYTREERETLLAAGVNHLTSERGRAFVIGNTTLGPEGSALRRLNVRRGTNFVRGAASEAARSALFEQNVPALRQEVVSEITDAVARAAEGGGIASFTVDAERDEDALRCRVALSFQDVVQRVTVRFSVLRDRVVFQ